MSARPAVSRYATPTAVTISAGGVMSNNSMRGRPSSRISPATSRFVLVPISVRVPPSWLPKDTGMKTREGAMPVRRVIPRITGMRTVTTGVLLMNALSGTAMRSVTTRRRVSLLAASRSIHRPRISIAPVRTRPADSTNMHATVTIASFAKPLIPSPGVTRPSSTSEVMTIRPATSTRTRFEMKRTRVPAVTARVRMSCDVMVGAEERS